MISRSRHFMADDAFLEVVTDMPSAQSIVIGRATAEFGLILFAWILIAWVFRLLYLVLTLREFEAVKAGGGLSIFEDVPMHHTVQQLDLDTRRRFLGFLRSRAPPMPAASVSNYIGPISLGTIRLHACRTVPQSARGSADVELTVEVGSTFPCTLQIFWADEVHSDLVDISRVDGHVASGETLRATGSADSPSCHGSLRGPSCRSRFAASQLITTTSSTALLTRSVSTARSTLDSLLSVRSTRPSRPAARSRTDPNSPQCGGVMPNAIELSTCSTMNCRTAIVEDRDRSSCGCVGGGSGSTAGGASQASGSSSSSRGGSGAGGGHGSGGSLASASSDALPSHTLPERCFTHRTSAVRIHASATPASLTLSSSELGDIPNDVLDAMREASRRSSAGQGPQPLGATAVLLFSNFAGCPPVRAGFAGRKQPPSSSAAKTMSSARLDAPPSEEVPPRIDDSLHASGADRSLEDPAHGLAGSRDGAGGVAASSSSSVLPTSLSTASRTPPLAFAATVSFRPESDETVGEGGSRTLVGTVAQQWMQTPAGLTQLAEVFGLEDWEVEKCVACMEEPKDTILLPCRHLCVCHECFELLTPLDRCPVCRAVFSSYLRFDTAAEAAAAATSL